MAKSSVKLTKRVGIEDILQKKQLLDDTINKPYYSDFFGGDIEVEDNALAKVSKIMQKAKDYSGDAVRLDLELIYALCPVFRSKELQKQFEVDDPIDVVAKSFNNNLVEISSLAKHIIKKYGLDIDKVSEIKKQ